MLLRPEGLFPSSRRKLESHQKDDVQVDEVIGEQL